NTDKAQASEFTDLFITLTRAVGIPARELDGFAYTINKNLRPLSLTPGITHAWPEYFDESNGWIMVDPTWENTSGGVDYFNKLDLNHFVLNIRGNSSTDPQPVSDVQASISGNEFNPEFKTQVEINVGDNLWASLPGIINVKILNNGTAFLDANNINITSNRINILDSKNITVSSIPPFGFTDFDVNFRTPFLTESISDEIVINYMGQNYSKTVKLNPFFLVQLFPYLFVFIVILVLGMYGFVLSVHIYKKRRSK
ncbi:MAG: transglutaminase domain-containing protein, partial [bacterium]|nr:transglutaminase domain-containing protein [bacterium]